MKKPSDPMRVTPRPLTVPVLKVTCSRITLRGPDHEFGGLALVAQMLGRAAEHAEGVHHAVLAKRGHALDHHVRGELHPRAQRHARPDHAEGSDLHVVGQLGPGVDQGGGMDGGHAQAGVGTTMAANSAWAASLSPT